ncbi:TRAP transporter substrate-binding protein DctP [Halodurantibacterium flavum]|uniref:TRAP transporter substrate-binding protein DctP n=1 Tax=Halodurantibacterium flavum TaxID=1382802 RepID=A0ABW4S1A3_9RHOB
MRQLCKALPALIGAAMPLAAAADTFVYGSFVPGSDYLNSDTLPHVFQMISDGTDGEIEWDLIVGGQLADGAGTFSAVEDRMMEAGLAIPLYAPSTVPNLAFLYSIVVPGDDLGAYIGAAMETIFQDCPGCLDDIGRTNAIPLGGFSNAANSLMCTRPVATLADLQGLRIRAVGGFGDMVAAGGAMPMSITLAETVTVLQRGGAECVVGAAEWLATYSYGDSAKYVTDLPLGANAPAVGLYMNREAFHEMTPEQQDVTLRAAAHLSAMQTIGNFVRKNAESLQRQIDTNGVQLVTPEQDLIDHVTAFPAGDRERRIEAGRQIGVTDPEALYDAYMANVEKWRGISAEIGEDVDALAQRIYDEAFADLDPSTL